MSSRYRLTPTPAQAAIMRRHCAHARFVWNLAAEQQSWWRPGRQIGPGLAEQCSQLTEARAASEWLREGCAVVQQQALRDFAEAMADFYRRTRGRPTWRKARQSEGFRVVGARGGRTGAWDTRRLSRHVGEVRIPKVGWVRFRWSRDIPAEAKSYRVTCDRTGRWHVSFTSLQPAVKRESTGTRVGIDRGVRTALVTSDGQHYRVPRIRDRQAERYLTLQRRLPRQHRDSRKRERTRHAMAIIAAEVTDRRKNWVEKVSTRMVADHDVIVLEKLNVERMTHRPKPRPDPENPGEFLPNGARAKAGLNQGILASCWGKLGIRIRQKSEASSVTAVFVNPRFTSQQCRVCGHIAPENRESQAAFRCVSCGHEDHADANAARNILARGLLLTTGEIVPAHAPGHGVSRPRQPAKAAAGTTRSAA